MISELTQDNLSASIATGTTVVQYSAGWCGNCRIMKPLFKKLGSEDTTNNFIIVDAEQFPESRKLANVNNLPTFAVFKDGQLINQIQTNQAANLKTFIHENTNH